MEALLEIKAVNISEHYSEVAAMMMELHKHEHSLFDKTAPWAEIEQTYMRHVITMQEDAEGCCMVAYIDNIPAGFIFGYIEEQDDSRIEVYEGKELYVSDGYIAEEHRRKGIYHELNRQLEQHYINKGVKRITRYTLINNTGMRALLEQQGYSVTRLLYEKWL
jgi:ribosomal protein S18 acetylase RimI-like enzyme